MTWRESIEVGLPRKQERREAPDKQQVEQRRAARQAIQKAAAPAQFERLTVTPAHNRFDRPEQYRQEQHADREDKQRQAPVARLSARYRLDGDDLRDRTGENVFDLP